MCQVGSNQRRIPVKASAVETDENPGIWEESIVLLKEFDVFKARFSHDN